MEDLYLPKYLKTLEYFFICNKSEIKRQSN